MQDHHQWGKYAWRRRRKTNLYLNLYHKVTINLVCLQIKECAAEERGKGYLVSCLVEHRTNISEYQCNQYITKMTSIVFSDYRLICGFMDQCKDDINKLHCGSVNTGEKVSPGALCVTESSSMTTVFEKGCNTFF